MFWIKNLGLGLRLRLDLEKLKRKMGDFVVSSVCNFLLYVALWLVTPYILKKLDST
ncbi:mitochondrial import receptor subunit TOM5 homolog [Trichosurus vulpecula]|uniref:mitochondrial import receptor subunit TOM5 homolog n=1 Tax=Trichosurus vulpecula TaxID=9337 RepID=UPI00186B25D1|nr:mitochondrial import receptor subunit TOM5 homolog [Trichosurus vulpecula]